MFHALFVCSHYFVQTAVYKCFYKSYNYFYLFFWKTSILSARVFLSALCFKLDVIFTDICIMIVCICQVHCDFLLTVICEILKKIDYDSNWKKTCLQSGL